ncbi:MAG: hypothetical protein MJ092_06775 [Lachnospiraceae bacterium]|nr:hypothetical protein [Lachnospiraceae bacterium]
MNWHKKIVFGEEAEKKRNKIINKLDNHKLEFGVYFVMLSTSEKDLLDIVPGYMIYKDAYQGKAILGVGLTKDEAFEVCSKLILRVFHETGDYDVRSYYR